MLAQVIRQKAKNQITVGMQEKILSPISAVGIGIIKVLMAVDYDDETLSLGITDRPQCPRSSNEMGSEGFSRNRPLSAGRVSKHR